MEDVNNSDGSYMEIESKQGQSRGLFIVSDEMLRLFYDVKCRNSTYPSI